VIYHQNNSPHYAQRIYCDLQTVVRCCSRCEATIRVEESVGHVQMSIRLSDKGANARLNRIHDDIGAIESAFLEDVDVCLNLDAVGVCSGSIIDDTIHEVA
jgi:hypothetical protein